GYRSRHDEPPWFAILNLTRPHQGIAQESRFQGLGISSPLHPRPSTALASKGRLSPALSSRRATCTADHLPRRAAGIPRSSNPPAMARNDSHPPACSSFMLAATSAFRPPPPAAFTLPAPLS